MDAPRAANRRFAAASRSLNRRGLWALAATAIAAATVPGIAQAGTVSSRDGRLSFSAARGEANDVSGRPSAAPGFYEVTDQGAPLTAVGACTSLSSSSARCPVPAAGMIRFSLGDGDDVIKVLGAPAVSVRGGEGDDTATGAEGDDLIAGQEGADTLRGGSGLVAGGFDTLVGGPGDDQLRGLKGDDAMYGGSGDDILDSGNGNGDDYMHGGPGADFLRGGRGFDTADYSDARSEVRVTIDRVADDGVAGENDEVLDDIERVVGGRHDDYLRGPAGSFRPLQLFGGRGEDVLIGALGDDRLEGGSGSDALNALAGADLLVGGEGKDWLSAGDGDDRVESRDGKRDVVGCGPGTDVVLGDGVDVLDLDGPLTCETLE